MIEYNKNELGKVSEKYGFVRDTLDSLTIAEIKKELFPVLGKQGHYDLDAEKTIAKDYINDLMILNESETEFVELLDKGIYNPEMLFEDKKIIDRIKDHPMAIWKCSKNRT